MSPIDAETKLYINEQNEKASKEARERTHKIANEITSFKFEVDGKFQEEREKNDKRYAPIGAWKILVWAGVIVGGIIIGSIIKLVIVGN